MAVQTSITMTPDRIRNKGPDFLRHHVNSNNNNNIFAHRRKSAVELLEASKSEYVKSRSVLKTKQELKHPENLHIGKPKTSCLGRSKSEYSLALGDSERNGNCIVGGPAVTGSTCGEREKTKSRPPDLPPKPSKGTIPSITARLNQVLQCETSDSSKINTLENGRPRSISANSASSNCLSDKSDQSNNNCIRSRTDSKKMNSKSNDGEIEPKPSRSKDPERPPRSRDCLLPSTYQSLSTSVTVLVEKRCAGSATTHTPTDTAILRRKKKTLHRSQSDLSCRHSRNSSDFSDLSSRLSRTSTELERFFNEMGIDKSVLDPMMKLQHNHKKESDYFESLSSLELGSEDRSSLSGVSQGAKSQTDKDKKEDIKERSSSQGTQVEKNARIIKWLCNVKKARFPPPQQAS
ncbi:protein FAM110B-like [Ylistrum balloti]|uniref:protein FAM110B-like n=1 Tax=Ylistrum balloti TaxID=509963 RepID=UPI002905A097|nr:protein FAM110B-like [Ylistrum balloti]